ncbi:DNA/RNA nuclease SfsA [Rhodophyticola sp. CCM32]|uniref:DNA/RNA nuclease SfsA n=1 Tax=Rhodophyticola sp. CCM32 TaxID=2916397 RepID=UPI00107F495E|nr:DNA/RNA nuclease SfsA [Rhodophyticola sp. CCM32]QBY01980.1 DNA/RNA nuclease SfsA [Rhodophyticola sp. CCM32]
MRFQTPLVPAVLIRRYNRFLADIRLEDGQVTRAHCPNPGSMMGLKDPDLRIWVEPNDDPKKKLRYGWRLVELPGGHWAGIDTGLPNRIVAEALDARAIPELSAFPVITPEVSYGQNSRVDFLLSGGDLPDTYVEVKNVTLRRAGDWAEFPDSVTTRGAKHLVELSEMVAQGHRAVMLYLLQRSDCTRLKMAGDLDPAYARAFDAARAAGVEMICYGTDISPDGIRIGDKIPVDIAAQI